MVDQLTNRPSRPDRLEIFSNDWGDRDDPDDRMETRLSKKNVCLRSHFHWSIVTDYRISNWRSSAFMYIKEEVLSMYLSLDLIMKAEEPMVFYDHLIFSLVFSKLQGSSQNDNAQLRTGTSRKIGIMII